MECPLPEREILVSEREAAESFGCTIRHLRRLPGRQFERSETPSRNGVAPRLYTLGSLPAEAQRRWKNKKRREKVVELVPADGLPSGQLALDLKAASSSPDGEELRRWQIIEPFFDRQKHAKLWDAHGTTDALVKFLAQQHNVKPRTIYRWLQAFKEGGLPALVKKDRRDKGQSKVLNTAALEFIVAAALPLQGSYGELSVREIFRSYREERTWRAAHRAQP
jgi:transposase-like protein